MGKTDPYRKLKGEARWEKRKEVTVIDSHRFEKSSGRRYGSRKKFFSEKTVLETDTGGQV